PSIPRGWRNRSIRSGWSTRSNPNPSRRTSSTLHSCRPCTSAGFIERKHHALALLWQIFREHGIPKSLFCDSWVVGFLEGPTMASRRSDWRDELGRWLKPFLDRLGHKTRRQMCPLYVPGLIGPGDRKSIQPMAERKPEMALAEIDRAIAAGVRFGCVLADAGYGLSAPFRQGLTAR